MDKETVLETCLAQFSPIRAYDLFRKVRERGCDLSRAQGYRYGRKLKKAGRLEQTNGIWYYRSEEKPKTVTDAEKRSKQGQVWESLKEDLANFGGLLTKVEFEKLHLGDNPDPITGWWKTFFDKGVIDGIMVLKGAKTLQTAARIFVPDEYAAFLLTQALVDEGDRVIWQTRHYKIERVESIYDGYSLSYRMAKLSVLF